MSKAIKATRELIEQQRHARLQRIRWTYPIICQRPHRPLSHSSLHPFLLTRSRQRWGDECLCSYLEIRCKRSPVRGVGSSPQLHLRATEQTTRPQDEKYRVNERPTTTLIIFDTAFEEPTQTKGDEQHGKGSLTRATRTMSIWSLIVYAM